MKQMNLGVRNTSIVFTAESPIKAPMLSLGDSRHIYQCGDRLAITTSENGGDVLGRSMNSMEALLPLLSEAKGMAMFASPFEDIPHCLALSPLIDVVGGSRIFWDGFVNDDKAISEFVQTYYPEFDMHTARESVKPYEDGVHPKQDNARVCLSVVPYNAVGTYANLYFGDHYVQAVVQPANSPTVKTPYIAFPDYNSLWKRTISRPDYYYYMWTHLWQQLLASCGVYPSSVGFYLSEKDGLDARHHSDVYDTTEVHVPENIKTAIVKYTMTL